jgi:hypothetical protein
MPSSTIGDEDYPCLIDNREWIVPDVPRVEPEESSDIDTYHREYDYSRHEEPCETTMIVDIPLAVDKFHRRISWDHPCERHSRDIDDIIVDHTWIADEVDEVREQIEAIWKKKEPEKEK